MKIALDPYLLRRVPHTFHQGGDIEGIMTYPGGAADAGALAGSFDHRASSGLREQIPRYLAKDGGAG